jgi:Fur family ferric uptake transcriptional regulator
MGSAITRPRQQHLLQVLQQAESELSAQALHQRLQATNRSTGLATVYRSLKMLQKAGLVRSRKVANGETLYAPLERDDHHLICVQCGVIQSLPHCPLGTAGLGLGAVLLQGFRPLFHTFEVHGLCSRCQHEEACPDG